MSSRAHLGRRTTFLAYFGGLVIVAIVTALLSVTIGRVAELVMFSCVLILMALMLRSERAAAQRDGRSIGQVPLIALVGGGFALVIATLLITPLVILVLNRPVPGTVVFGTGGSECSVSGQATAFRAGQSLRGVAYFSREVIAGEVLHRVVSDRVDGQELHADEVAYDTAVKCVYFNLPDFAPGEVMFEYSIGSEVLATGELVIVEP